jgi:hypothetical protein
MAREELAATPKEVTIQILDLKRAMAFFKLSGNRQYRSYASSLFRLV